MIDDQISNLNNQSIKALRFNIGRGGSEDLSKLDYFAKRVFKLASGHSKLYIDAKDLPEISSTIKIYRLFKNKDIELIQALFNQKSADKIFYANALHCYFS